MYLCTSLFDGLTFLDKKLLKDVRVSVCHSPKCDREYPNPGPDKSKSTAPNKGRCLVSAEVSTATICVAWLRFWIQNTPLHN